MRTYIKKNMNIILLLIIFISLTSCKKPDYHGMLEEKECGIYRYAVREFNDGRTEGYLLGLTEEAKELKEIIIPEYLDGVQIVGFGYEWSTGFMTVKEEANFTNVEKMYFNFDISEKTFDDNYRQGNYYSTNLYAILWNEINSYNLIIYNHIYGFNLYSKFVYVYDFGQENYLLANVSYMYNYDNCPNEGYYWVDSYNESIITFIPPNPEREGYIFDGWYKEEECINKWDFNTDITGEELIIEYENQYEEYPGIYLYAKWIEE